MRIACSLGSLLTVDQVMECSRVLSGTQVDTIWIPETWGMENFAMLGAVSGVTTSQRIGSSIINIYSRSPALIAMGAATADALSGQRLVLGLGTSSMPIVEDLHGYRFRRPLERMREYVGVIRQALSGGPINHSGPAFSLKNFELLVCPERRIPIYLAAVNRGMVNLAWEIGDGVIFYLRPLGEMRDTIRRMGAKGKIDVSCQIITCVSEDSDAALNRARKTLAFYVSVGQVYREFLARNGFGRETAEIFDEFKRTGFKTNHRLVSDSMLGELAICGTPRECRVQLAAFQNTGMDLPIIQFNPVGDVAESLNLVVETFLGR